MTRLSRTLGTAAVLGAIALWSAPAGAQDAQSDVQKATLRDGATITYGLTLAILQYSTTRSAAEPARFRNYASDLQVLPPEIGFQFIFNPPTTPWRLTKQDGTAFQLMSIGGSLLTRIRNQSLEQGNISLAVDLGFFDNAISVGMGVDLYRGIPVLSADGVVGGATAYTGLLAAGFAKEGEVTPENVFVIFSFSLTKLVGAISGNVKP